MRAVLCLDDGGLESIELREVADPTIGPDQVLVEVHAASVEFVDTLIATGLYQIKVPTPYTPGNNLAGVVLAVGEEKLEFCRSIGADETVNYSQDGFKETLKQLCPKGVDIVLDPVGGEYSEEALRAVGYGGRFVVIGFASGSIPKIPLNLVLLKGSTITGYEIGDFQRLEPETAARNRDHLEAMLAAGTIKAPITKRFSMSQAVDAIAYVGGRDKFGMTVLTPQQ